MKRQSLFFVILIASLACAAPPAHAGAKAAKPIIVDSQLNGNDAKDRKLKASPAKVHKMSLTKGTVYVIDLVSKDFDAFLRLEDSEGNPLAEDDDGGGGFNARLFFIPPATAEYALIATSHNAKSGKYRLTVQESGLQATPLKLERGAATVQDKLTVNGLRSPFSPHNSCKIFRVDLSAGTTYVIDLESAAFDAYLSLGDPSLRLLASDDDSGGKLNARLRFECKADGAYHLVATGLGQPEGAFTLKIAAGQ
jgi:hypothetical protein